MQTKYVDRHISANIEKRLEHNPVVALLGARQVGKSTLAKHIVNKYDNSIYLHLEKSSDRLKIESLAGRIAYIEITPFSLTELPSLIKQTDHWLKGGYPKSILQSDMEESINWRLDYIKTFLERDIPQLGFSIPALTLERFWTMLAHSHCQLVNYSNLGKSLGVSHHTIKSYIDILEQTFVIKTIKPYSTNQGKRLVKSPKVYIRDTGLLHTLLGIEEMNGLLGHPVAGNSFESYVIENILIKYPRWKYSFYRDSSGNEVDLVLEKGDRCIAIEIKSSTAPTLEKGFWNSIKFLNPTELWVIAQVDYSYPGPRGVMITNLEGFLKN